MNELECVKRIKDILTQMFSEVNTISIIESKNEVRLNNNSIIDLLIKVKTNNDIFYNLLIEVKSLGQPKYIRYATEQLKRYLFQTNITENCYGIIGVPFISENSIQICKDENIGYIDLAGNCYIKFDGIYINFQGKSNPFPNTRPLKSIISKKSTRALRVLLNFTNNTWFVKDLANEANISLGQASNIKKRLIEYEFIKEIKTDKGPAFFLENPNELLNYWKNNYTYKKNKIFNYYVLDDIREFENKFSEFCKKRNILYAFTLTSGSARIAPSLRYNRGFAYIEDNLKEIEDNLKLKKVESGSNFSILVPYDEGVFNGIQKIDDQNVVSNIQLYLDLFNYKGRGEEAAQIIYERFIEKQWLQNQIIKETK